jgi:hypothetical protein
MDILPQAPVVPRDCLAVTNYDYVDLRVASPCPREAPTVAELRREPLPDADPGMTRPPRTAMRRYSKPPILKHGRSSSRPPGERLGAA